MPVKILRIISFILYAISWLFVIATLLMYFNIDEIRKEYGVFTLLRFAGDWTKIGLSLLMTFLLILGIYYLYNKKRLKRLNREINDLQQRLASEISKK